MRFYVYELVDPRDNSVFYIGKGQYTRLTSHFLPSQLKKPGRKTEIIKEIIAAGYAPIARKIRSFKTDMAACDFEKRLIISKRAALSNKCVPRYAEYLSDGKSALFAR